MRCPVILSAAKNLALHRRETLRIAQGDRLLIVLGLSFLLAACAGSSKAPDWVNGPKAAAYPDAQYMVGVGQGDSRAVAEQRAYAAVSRIFKADIASQSRDWETYLNLEHTGSHHMERRLTVETMTRVSTDKILENVRIVDTWSDPKTNLYSALAVLDRASTKAVLLSRISELDEAIERNIQESREAHDKLLTLRQLHRAVRNLITRETLNSELRIVSGQVMSSQFSVPGLTQDLDKFLSVSLIVAVEVTGDQSDAVRQAIIETLLREGFPVTASLSRKDTVPDLLVRGETRLWPADLPDPKFRYVRWCGDFTLVSPESQRIFGAIARSGREGHLNYREASNRALLALKHEVGRAVVKTLSEQFYGDTAADLAPPIAACPRR
ncbi:MAG: LPP20 family lipoprotein [Nitrospirota bacterium]